MDNTNSGAWFDTAKVIKHCQRYLQARQETIDRMRELMITTKMREKRHRFWGPTLTREEAIKRLQSEPGINDYECLDWTGSFWGEAFQKLIITCENCKTGEVYIETKLASVLFGATKD